MALSRASARGMWDSSARDAYRSATNGIKSSYRNCVKVAGDNVSFAPSCLKKAAEPLRSALSSAWTD
jgi:hypothetical protein